VTVVGARGIRNADWFGSGASDCFCTFGVVGGEQLKTKVIQDSLEPFWGHEAELSKRAPGQDLVFQVWDQDPGKPDYLLGKVTLSSKLFEAAGYNGEVALESDGKGANAILKIKVKLAGKDYPQGKTPEISLTFASDAKSSGHGLDYDTLDGIYGRVTKVKDGMAVAKYNATKPPSEQIEAGDFIYEVDGVSGKVSAMEAAMSKPGNHTLKIRKSMYFTVLLKKQEKDKTWAMNIKILPTSSAALIESFTAGPVTAWNASNATKQLKAGDFIVAANGIQGSAEKITAALKDTSQVQLLISRPYDSSDKVSSWW